MKKWTEEKLKAAGYSLQNAKITNVDLSMADHGVLTLDMVLDGGGWGCVYGGRVLGKGFVGADEEDFSGTSQGIVYIERIMDVVGVDRFNKLKGEYVRVASRSFWDSIDIIGNIIKDKWFDQKSFFEEGENKNAD